MTAKSAKHSRRSKPETAPTAAKASAPWIAESYHRHLQLAVFVIGFFLCGFISIHLGQDNNWDLRNYHYYNPFAFLTGRLDFDFAPAQLQSYLNPLLDLPFYLGITYLPPKLLGFLMGGIHGLNIGLVFATAFLLFRTLSPNLRLGLSIVCAALGSYAPIFIGELGASQNDTLISLFALTALYLFLKALADHDSLSAPEARNRIIIASLIFGMGVGLKLTLLIYAVGIAAAFLIVETSWSGRARVLLLWCGAFLIGFLITNGFWMAKLYHHFQNPLFPFYNQIFQSPWADPVSYGDNRYLAETFLQGLIRPFEIAFDNHYTQTQNMARDSRYAVIYVLLIIFCLYWFAQRFLIKTDTKNSSRKSGKTLAFSKPELFLLVFFIVSYFIWQYKFSVIRYTSVTEQVGPLLIVLLLFKLISNGLLRTGILAAAFVYIFVAMNSVQHERVRWGDEFWNVQLPAISNPQNTLVIMANTRPWGYLVPLFPGEIRWVRVFSNLTDPSKQTIMQSEIRRVIADHDGDIYLLSRSHPSYYSWLSQDSQVVAAYGLTVDTAHALPITSAHSRPGLALWPVSKQNR